MKNARQILEEFTASSFRDPRKAAEMFAEDGAFEMPYLGSLGFPWRYEGREKVEGFFKFVRDLYPDMDFQDSASGVKFKSSCTPGKLYAATSPPKTLGM